LFTVRTLLFVSFCGGPRSPWPAIFSVAASATLHACGVKMEGRRFAFGKRRFARQGDDRFYLNIFMNYLCRIRHGFREM
jgi:hypothetical protein